MSPRTLATWPPMADQLRHVVRLTHGNYHTDYCDKTWLECPRDVCQASVRILIEAGLLEWRDTDGRRFVDFV